MNRRALPLGLLGLVVVGLLAALALGGVAARSGGYAPELPAAPRSAPPPVSAGPPPEVPSSSQLAGTPTPQPRDVDPTAGRVVLTLGGVLAVVVAALVVRLAVRHRPRRRPRPPDAAVAMAGTLPEEVMPRAVDRALLAVEQPDAREAVVAAWLLLGAAAAEAGTPARAAETATEYAERLAAAHGLPAASVHALAGLYREARFSDHPVREGQRARARTELTALRASLSAGTVR